MTKLERSSSWILAAAVLCAFAIRVLPSWPQVFQPGGVNFQEPDAWYHMRTVQNLLQHFPFRSEFDPYAIYPGGQAVPTGPLFDLLIATIAWIVGFGSPSRELTEVVGAIVPALLGAILPLPVYLLCRRFYESGAALIAACCTAAMPGAFLWIGHLGVTDHHIAESLFALLTLLFVCSSAESGRLSGQVLAGLSLAALLGTRPAGFFIVPVFAAVAILQPSIPMLRTLTVTFSLALIAFAPIWRVQWGGYAVIALAAGIAACGATWYLAKRGWQRWALLASSVIACAVYATNPHSVADAFYVAARAFGFASTSGEVLRVQEMRPLMTQYGDWRWSQLFYHFGAIWIAAIPGVLLLAHRALRERRPPLTLFLCWNAVVIVLTFAQVRMAAYGAVSVAMLAGYGAWQVNRIPARTVRTVTLAIALILLFAPTFSVALRQMRATEAPGLEWRQALDWMRLHTPEPLGDPGAYDRWYASTATFPYPSQAYGVLAWWDYGYWIEYLARRIPTANGTQAGATQTALALTAPDPADALARLRNIGARYLILDPNIALNGPLSRLPLIAEWAGEDRHDYYRILFEEQSDGRRAPLIAYLPKYYRSLAIRLYVFDGRSVDPRHQTWVIAFRQARVGDRDVDLVQWKRAFRSYAEAQAFVAARPFEQLLIAGLNWGRSCVPLEEFSAIRRVHLSGAEHQPDSAPPSAVKIFEVTPFEVIH